MMDKIKNVIKPSEDMKYKKFINNFRKEHIPEQYNQIKLLDELNNPDIDNFISISNRTDGKSINYGRACVVICIKHNLGLRFLRSNMMLRASYQELINDIIELSSIFDRSHFNLTRTQYYVSLNYKDQTIAITSDVN